MPSVNDKNQRITKADIKHKGFVKEIRDNVLIVNIVNESACSSCHAKGACSVADFQDKEIEIDHFSGHYRPGQEVTVLFQESKGVTAIFYGYLLPFLLVLIVLIVTSTIGENELINGLVSIGILIPYYTTLYFFRHLLKKVFKFEVEENH
ncbi:MAG: RseC/MucC family positive regulator of sigma(E) [Draconibacterium sp.]|nr:MAG: RseC/MucC family positive regulator of sigma(E) [Draconibacterium sp.]PIF06467.1 MAG: RseC/MucC family positive regulator of sigma(E) [Draconibacterium sp.]